MAKKKSTRKKPRKDPNAAREAERYDRPIASRELILEVLREQGVPLWAEDLSELLDIKGDDGYEALRRRLNAMVRDGQLVRNRREGYMPVDRSELVRGRISGHQDGFGFLIPDSGGDDLYLSSREMRQVLHGDRVVGRVTGKDRRGRLEGAIVEVLERGIHRVVGRFYRESGVGFVVPDNKRVHQDVLISPDRQGNARDGQIVSAEILEYPTRRNQPIGQIVEVLGDHMDPGMEIDIAIRSHGLPLEWPEAVKQEVAGLSEKVSSSAKRGRVDFRDTPLVTIDGEDARDFDDAIFCERKPRGWRVLVAIADVSHYVRPRTALDQEAAQRGNSVYFPERVIPMLPEVLSNGLCSLNPEVDRLCMVCEMNIGDDGKINRSRFHEGLMRSHARLTYSQVSAALYEGNKAERKRLSALMPHLEELGRLYKIMREARRRRGAIDFETTETRIIFGDDRKIERIVPVERNNAHKIVEECMIAANVAAARFLERKKIPTLFRIHEGPGSEKLNDLREFLGELGLSLRGGKKPEAKHYAELLEKIRSRPDAHLIQTVMLRSLSQAKYSPDNIGHFGLAHTQYLHFTSPIRRYPDLLVHRAIRHLLRNKPVEKFPYDHEKMETLGESSSMTERRADDATRDAVDWLKCEFMLDKVGEEYEGIITGVTSFGIFVELSDIFVEGLVHVTALQNDFYHFDHGHHRLVGERTGITYRLGDSVRVSIARVNLDERKIDFELAKSASRKDSGRKKHSDGKRSRGKYSSRRGKSSKGKKKR